MQGKSRFLAAYAAILAISGAAPAMAAAEQAKPAEQANPATVAAKMAAPAAPAVQELGLKQEQLKPEKMEQEANIRFHFLPVAEQAAGAPGYYAELDFLRTESEAVPGAAEIGNYIGARVLDKIFTLRRETAEDQMPKSCAEQEPDSTLPCRNEADMQAAGLSAKGSLISVRYLYTIAPYATAHPVTYPIVYNFALKPLYHIDSLADLFAEPNKAFPIIQGKIRAALLAQRGQDGQPLLDKNMVKSGTADWKAFSAYNFGAQGIKVEFAPYAVAAYALGPQQAELPYGELKPLLKPFYRAALGLN